MKLSKEVKQYLNTEIIKETASGYDYRMINGKRQKINPSDDIPNDCIVVCNSAHSYHGYVDWALWVKDPNNKYFDIYYVSARAKLDANWNIELNSCYSPIGTRHYADKTSIDIYYNEQTGCLEAATSKTRWREAKQPIEVYDKDPSRREKDTLSLRNLTSYQATINEKRPVIWAPKVNDNWSWKELSSEIRQIIADVYDLTNFTNAYPNGVRIPQDLLNFLQMSDEQLLRRANIRKDNEDSLAVYKEATKGLQTIDTAFRIGDKVYFNRNDCCLYVKNLKTNTLVCYTDFNRTAIKSGVSKRGAVYLENNDIFSQIPLRNDWFKGCFDENGKQISFAECFGKQSNVTTFFECYDASEQAKVVLNLFTIRGQYAKILELAIKSENKFLIQKIMERKVLTKEQYDKQSSWGRRNFICFDGTKTNIPQMLNVSKYTVNQIKNLPVHQDIDAMDSYLKLSTLFNNLSIADFIDIYQNKCNSALTYEGYEELHKFFAKDGLQAYKKRIAAYGRTLMRYKDYLRMIEQLKALSETDPTVVFNPNEWPLFPEAAIKHITLYAERTYYGNSTIGQHIQSYTRYTLGGVEYTILSNTEEQAVLELKLSPAQHVIYLEAELAKIFNIYKDKARSEAFKQSIKRLKTYEFSDGTLSVVAPTQASDLTTEGAVLHHCVGSFIDAVANNKENVVFIRRNDMLSEPYYTMAISPSGNIEQVHCVHNGDLSKDGQERAYQTTGRDVYNTRFDLIKFLKQWATAMRAKGVMINPNTIQLSYGALAAHNY